MSGERSLVLASASPRRRELLEAAGWRVEVRPADLDESQLPGEPAAEYVLRLARAKARAIAPQTPDACVLGADTTVVLGDELLAKPADEAEARAMLRRLSGRAHEVLTGVCLIYRGVEVAAVDSTGVQFMPLTSEEIEAYAASGEPEGKAGAYAIQGRAACFIPRIEGSYSNVVGLPLALVYQLWRQLKIPPSGQ